MKIVRSGFGFKIYPSAWLAVLIHDMANPNSATRGMKVIAIAIAIAIVYSVPAT